MDIDADRAALEAWLILLRAPGLGPGAIRGLLARHGDVRAALAAARQGDLGERRVAAGCRGWLAAPRRETIEADLAWLAASDHALLTSDAADFPALLEDSPSPPAALFVAGDAGLLWQPQIAIVGSRHASQGGRANAAGFARALAQAGFTITSGLAEGIDGAAHAAALDAGGRTLAVLGTGADRVYPDIHQELAARIAAEGALVSEFPPGTPAHPAHFPRRNRIIAALAFGTLVVEASVRSGSLITARNAAESGREVFALPGSIHNPLARGCHQLIRNGARLVETCEDLVGELAPLASHLGAQLRERLGGCAPVDTPAVPDPRATDPRLADPAQARLQAALGHDPVGIDELAERTGFDVARVSSLLLMLELEGAIVPAGGGAWARKVGAAPPR